MKPKLLNQDMVRALLLDSKTQTRELIKPQPGWIETPSYRGDGTYIAHTPQLANADGDVDFVGEEHKSKYQVGDVLYVRERTRYMGYDGQSQKRLFKYEADESWSKSLILPKRIKEIPNGHCCSNGCFKELARIFLKVTAVRVEQIRSISEADAIAEGIDTNGLCVCKPEDYLDNVRFCGNCGKRAIDLTDEFRSQLWDSLYPGSWKRNDYVFVYEIERCEKNE